MNGLSRRYGAAAVGAAALIGAAAAHTGAAAAATVQSVAITNYMFQPQVVTVPLGSAVKWTNKDTARHTTTSDIAGPVGWDHSLGHGGSFTKTLTAAGTYRYVCLYHTSMNATVLVPVKVALRSGKVTVTLATEAAPTGFSYRPEVRVPGSSGWTKLAATTSATVTYSPGKHGIYKFRSKVKHGSAQGTDFSPTKSISIG